MAARAPDLVNRLPPKCHATGARSLPLLVLLVLAACVPSTSTSPSPPPTTGGEPIPTATADASPSPTLRVERATFPVAADPSALRDVVRGGPGLVAVGDALTGAIVWISSDGVAWEAVTAPERTGMASATTFGPSIVAVGRDLGVIDEELATAWLSEDGRSWRRAQGELADGQMIDVTTAGPGLVAVGSAVALDATAVWASLDGLTWERVPHGPAFENAFMWSIVEGGPGLVAVGWRRTPEPSAAVWVSTDGRTWERVPDPEDGAGYQMRAVAPFADGLVAAGDLVNGGRAAVWTSADGRTWERVADSDVFADAFINAIVPMNSMLLGFGGVGRDAAIWTSRDGRSWTVIRHEAITNAYLTSAVRVGDRIVAVGATQERIPGTQSFRQTAAAWTIEFR